MHKVSIEFYMLIFHNDFNPGPRRQIAICPLIGCLNYCPFGYIKVILLGILLKNS